MATWALLLKILHVLAATLFFGAGLATAWLKLRADRSGDPRVIAWACGHIVHADLVFTIPAGIAMPLTGVAMVVAMGLPWDTPFVVGGFVGWAVAGLFWLPAWRLQYRMRALAEAAAAAGSPLPDAYHHATRAWTLLGVPSFCAAVATIVVMVAHRIPFFGAG